MAPEGQNKREFTLPTQILFCVFICLFGFASAINPLGPAGLPLAVLSAAISVLLALSFRDDAGRLGILLAVNLIPFITAALVLHSVSHALAALFPLMMALPIWLTVRMHQGRSASIAASAVMSALLWILYLALAIAAEYGACNRETITEMLDTALAPVADALRKMTVEYEGETVPYYTENNIELLIYYTKTMLFGAIGAMMIVCSYLVTLTARLIAGVFHVTPLLPLGLRVMVRAKMTEDGPRVEVKQEPVVWRIEIDSVTTAVFLIAYIVSMIVSFAGNGALTVYSALQNLVLLLTPGFLYCGIRDVVLGIRGKGSFGGISMFTLIFGAILFFVNPTSVITLLAALGVAVTLRENRMKRGRELRDGKNTTDGKE
jgi:hypothetical protein